MTYLRNLLFDEIEKSLLSFLLGILTICILKIVM